MGKGLINWELSKVLRGTWGLSENNFHTILQLLAQKEAPSAPQAHKIYGFLHTLNSYLVYDPLTQTGHKPR